MNIIYLNSHDTGRHIGPYGGGARTPNLQRLAEEGALFRQAFNAGPTCSPSRAALCTGQYPHNCGMIGLGHRGFFSDFDHHLANTLKANGYETATWGMTDNHMGTGSKGKGPDALGYDKVMPGWDIAPVVEYVKGNHDKPFFLNVALHLTHRRGPGFETDRQPGDDPRYVRLPAVLPDTARVREDWAHFLSDAAALDAEMGKIISAVDNAGLGAGSLIIATTDHGVAFPGMKCNLTTHGCGVFLIMRGPAGFTGGKVVDGMVSQIDIFPTVCEILRIENPKWLDGVSFMPLVRGGKDQIHDEIFAEVSHHAAYEPMRSVRTPRYAYIKRFGDRRRPVLANCDASPSKDEWLDRGFANLTLPDEELYDTFYDPEEMNNLTGDLAHADTLNEMRARLDGWMARANDPLLKGPVPVPDGAWTNDVDGVHPTFKKGGP